jgi:hypothetical protein
LATTNQGWQHWNASRLGKLQRTQVARISHRPDRLPVRLISREITLDDVLSQLAPKPKAQELLIDGQPIADAIRTIEQELDERDKSITKGATPPVKATNQSKIHETARNKAENLYTKAVLAFMAVAAAEAVRKKRRKTEDFWLSMMLLVSEEAYISAYAHLADQAPNEQEAQAFAQSRQEFIKPFADRIAKELAEASDAADPEQKTKAIRKKVYHLEQTEGKRLAETEAQITYGVAIDRVIQRAGFSTKLWQTVEDEHVRHSHMENQRQGDIPLARQFSNGLRFPGDPEGPLDEIIGCRCWLEGGKREHSV